MEKINLLKISHQDKEKTPYNMKFNTCFKILKDLQQEVTLSGTDSQSLTQLIILEAELMRVSHEMDFKESTISILNNLLEESLTQK